MARFVAGVETSGAGGGVFVATTEAGAAAGAAAPVTLFVATRGIAAPITLVDWLVVIGELVAPVTALLIAWRNARRMASTCSELARAAFVLALVATGGGVCAGAVIPNRQLSRRTVRIFTKDYLG